MRILKQRRTLLAASALCALLPLLAYAEDDPKPTSAKQSAYVMKIYDVRALTSLPTDWPGPASLLNPRELGPGGGGGPFAVPAAACTLSPADIANLIQERYLPNDFANQAEASILEQAGQLVVLQTPAVQAKIPALLRNLQRQFKRRVSVQGLEVAVTADEAVRWLGKAGTPVPQKSIDAYFAKESGVTVVSTPQVAAYSGQRTHAFAGETATFTADLDAAGTVLMPVVATRYEGGLFDVKPALNASGTSVLLSLRYGRRKPIENGADSFEFRGAAATAEKPAAPNAAEAKPDQANAPAGAPGGTIDLPKAHVRTLSTDLTVPCGTWTLAATLDPAPGAAKGSTESKWILLFVRCEELVGNGGL